MVITRSVYPYEGNFCFDENVAGYQCDGCPPQYQKCFKTKDQAECEERNEVRKIDKYADLGEAENCKIYDKDAIDVQKIKDQYDQYKGVYDALKGNKKMVMLLI